MRAPDRRQSGWPPAAGTARRPRCWGRRRPASVGWRRPRPTRRRGCGARCAAPPARFTRSRPPPRRALVAAVRPGRRRRLGRPVAAGGRAAGSAVSDRAGCSGGGGEQLAPRCGPPAVRPPCARRRRAGHGRAPRMAGQPDPHRQRGGDERRVLRELQAQQPDPAGGVVLQPRGVVLHRPARTGTVTDAATAKRTCAAPAAMACSWSRAPTAGPLVGGGGGEAPAGLDVGDDAGAEPLPLHRAGRGPRGEHLVVDRQRAPFPGGRAPPAAAPTPRTSARSPASAPRS